MGKKFQLFIPIIFIFLYHIITFFIISHYIEARLHVDYHIFYETYQEFFPNYYEYKWFVYLPAFYFQFFWIGRIGFNIEIIIWILLNSILLILVWYLIIQEKFFTSLEKKSFLFIVIGLGLLFEIIVANTDIILLFCGFFSYFLLDYGEKSMHDSKKIFMLEFCAGCLFAFGLFKPLILIWLPLLLIKSKHPHIFISGLFCWILLSNNYFFRYPMYFDDFLKNVKSGKSIYSVCYKIPFFNYLWKMAYSGFRHQIYIFPALLLYNKRLIKNEKQREKHIRWYCIIYPVFEITGLVLFYLGF